MIPISVQDKVFAITAAFQSGSGYDSVTGNHNGELLSAGINQWSFGMATLQPLLKEMIKRAPGLFTTHLGSYKGGILLALANGQSSWRDSAFEFTGVPLDRRGQTVLPAWRPGMMAIMGSDIGIQVQRESMAQTLDQAWRWCQDYGVETERALSLFFDIRIQNGFIEPQTRSKILDRFQPGMAPRDKLRVVVEERVTAVTPRGRGETLNRKMCILTGRGDVKGRSYDLEKEFALTDAPIQTA
jgi:hypothetical protein